MSDAPVHARDKVLCEGKYLRLLSRDTWEFAQRKGSTGVVGIVAVTPDEKLLLVEQYRRAVDAEVIEVPAGLAGDLQGGQHEDFALAARRELIEETGYDAESFTLLSQGPSSAGLTDEVVVLYRAEKLIRVSSGGGDESEQIRVHEIPLTQLPEWLNRRVAEGRLIDFKVWAAIAFLSLAGSASE